MNNNDIIDNLKIRIINLEKELNLIKQILCENNIHNNKNISNVAILNETIIELKDLSSYEFKYPLENLNFSYIIRKKCEIKNMNDIFDKYQYNICIIDNNTTDLIFINQDIKTFISGLIYTPNKNTQLKINIKNGLGKILKNNYHSDFYVHKNYQQEKYRYSNLDFDNHTFLNPNYYCTNCKFICSCDGDIDKYECLGH